MVCGPENATQFPFQEIDYIQGSIPWFFMKMIYSTADKPVGDRVKPLTPQKYLA